MITKSSCDNFWPYQIDDLRTFVKGNKMSLSEFYVGPKTQCSPMSMSFLSFCSKSNLTVLWGTERFYESSTHICCQRILVICHIATNPSTLHHSQILPKNSRVLRSKMSEFIRKNEKDHQFTWNFSKTDCACILCHRCSLHRSSLVMNINGRVCNAFVFCFLLILCYVFILFRSSSKLDCSVKSEMVKYWNCEHESDVSSINKSKLVNLCTYTLCAWIDKTIVDNVLHRL